MASEFFFEAMALNLANGKVNTVGVDAAQWLFNPVVSGVLICFQLLSGN